MWLLKWIGIAAAIFVGISKIARADALDTWPVWSAAQPYVSKQVPPEALIVRGSGTDAYYVLEVDPATGALPVYVYGGSIIIAPYAYAYADSVINLYASTNVTTSEWVEIKSATAAAIKSITLFDSCGQTLELGVGAEDAETRVLLIPPGGIDGQFNLSIAASSRLALKAVTGNCTSGAFVMTGFQ